MEENIRKQQPFYYIFLLMLAGEAVFILPFVIARIFRPTFLDLFQVNNLQLGYCFSIYGIVALVSYFFGGLIADRFPPGKLMGIALILTALGGILLAQYPSLLVLKLIYGYWGCTTILLFWAAMIKATRIWGGKVRQGKAFGFLDGGRGLVAAAFGSMGLFVISFYVVGDLEDLSFQDRRIAFRNMIWTFSIFISLIGVLIYFVLRYDSDEIKQSASHEKKAISFNNISLLLKRREIWLMMIIILTGYCGYKITDIISLYARDVMEYDEIKAAGVGTMLLYLRPIVGIAIGVLADRSKPSTWILSGFVLMFLGSLVLLCGIIGPSVSVIFMLSVVTTSLGIYAIRSLYFAIMEEGSIPIYLTGAAVGLVSLVGFTPDIFMGPLIGVLLDNNPGELGHQYIFGLLALFSVIGLVCITMFRVKTKQTFPQKAQ